MQYSFLQQAVIQSFIRLEPNLSTSNLTIIADVINAFEHGRTYLDLTNYDLDDVLQLANCNLVGTQGEFKPLIKDGNYLYLARYYAYESYLANELINRSAKQTIVNQENLKHSLAHLFTSNDPNDLQRQTAINALHNNLTIIAGGPGTGKTTTVVKILVALLEQNPATKLKIALAAPTGKAATRMSEAINNVLPYLKINDEIKQLIQTNACTLHRLLGSKFNSPAMRYNLNQQLNLDVLIIDEASMLDLALMAKILMALPQNARLILLGDSNQLSAVEAGAIFGDLCNEHNKLSNAIIHLQTSHRFKDNSNIGNFVSAIKNGNSASAINLFNQTDLNLFDLDLVNLKQHLTSNYQSLLNCAKQNNTSPALVFQEFARFRALSMHNHGKFGVSYLNQYLDDYFNLQAKTEAEQSHNNWYAGKAIMITRNDYNLKLFNGDIGICLLVKNKQTGQTTPRIFFEDGINFRSFAPSILPEHTSAFVMTVHKSQGSEFDHVAVILPNLPNDNLANNNTNELLNRSLLYTAVTRAKSQVTIWAQISSIEYAINNHLLTTSSLSNKLKTT